VPTVPEGLKAIAKEIGIDSEAFPEFERVWIGSRINDSLPERYRRLTQEELYRLPWDWDRNCEWSVVGSDRRDPSGYGSVLRFEEGEGDYIQEWEVTLYPAMLDLLSDGACRWVIAHELAHVASGIPTGSVVIDGKAATRIKGTVDQYQEAPSKAVHEDAADQIALEWGFSGEMQALVVEDR